MNDGYAEVLDAIASDSPTPGGGSVAALALAHSHALLCMVARLTLKSSKWESGHDAATEILQSSQEGITYALNLSHRDAESFESVMQAYRMPKSSDHEIAERTAAIARGYLKASSVPLETAESGLILLNTVLGFATSCNANAITDLAAAAQMGHSAVTIAGLNVRINLTSMKQEESVQINNSIDNIELDADSLADEIMRAIAGRM